MKKNKKIKKNYMKNHQQQIKIFKKKIFDTQLKKIAQ